MSRTQEQNLQSAFVIARAFGDEPLKLRLVKRDGGVVEIALPDSTSVLFPQEDVFSFDESLFGKLRRAFSAGDVSALQELWSRAG